MAILPIITYPNSILEKKTKKISDPKATEIKQLILGMLETLKNSGGVGLAAPQIGNSLRLSIIQIDGKTHILINPKFKYKSWKKIVIEEGCLSFPGVFFPVKRHSKVTIENLNKDGSKKIIKAEGLFAQALQHEIDHLDGILFISRKVKTKKS